MMDSKSDRALEEELRRLPRQVAPPGFTQRILTALEEPPAHRPVLLPALAWTGALSLILGIAVTWTLQHRSTESTEAPVHVDVEHLRGEHQALQEELDLLQHEIEAVPLLYLGSDENLDLVLDLGNPASVGTFAAPGAVPASQSQKPRPASYRD